ncbi:MAG: LD-carboxypeptidase [Symploca sp. SIO2E6]|nr:LD-carboxypeptidase [Symploca sp. SIO2E6]
MKQNKYMSILLRPPSFKMGSNLAVFSPSSPGNALFPHRLKRGVTALESLGFQVQVPEFAFKQYGYTAGTAEERANELMRLFEDDTVDGIICSIGGFNSSDILPLLDYSIISKHPKIFAGYSDVTALLLGIYAQTNLVTFHAPAILPEWGDYPEPLAYTVRSFRDLTEARSNFVKYQPPNEWTNEFLDWHKGEDNRPKNMYQNLGWKVLKEGVTVGCLIGGNIETLNFLVGTPYCPDFSGSVLFLEATDAEAYLPRLHRALTHLCLCGVFDKISGLLVGKCPDAHPVSGIDLETVISVVTKCFNIPIALNIDLGHTNPMLTLPIGIQVKLSCIGTSVSLELLESAVS